jgi:alpha-glucosidase
VVSLSAVEGGFKSRFTSIKFVLHGFEKTQLKDDVVENQTKEIIVELY